MTMKALLINADGTAELLKELPMDFSIGIDKYFTFIATENEDGLFIGQRVSDENVIKKPMETVTIPVARFILDGEQEERCLVFYTFEQYLQLCEAMDYDVDEYGGMIGYEETI